MKIAKFIIILLIVFTFNFIVKAQVCGYVHITFNILDHDGNLIKNAEIDFFDSKFKAPFYFHKTYYRLNGTYDSKDKRFLKWVKEKQAFYGVDGMCGGHRNVGVKIKTKGYETFSFVENFSLGWHSFLIKLSMNGEKNQSSKERLATVRGHITDRNNTKIDKAKIYLTNEKLNVIQKETNNSYFLFYVPEGSYKIEVVPENGLTPMSLENEKLNKGYNYLDIKINNKEEK